MPLITCPDCSSQVSDAAPACPKCGRPIAAVAAQPVSVQRGIGTGVKIGFGMFIVLPLLLFGGCLFFFSMLFTGASRQYETYKQQAAREKAAAAAKASARADEQPRLESPPSARPTLPPWRSERP